jgi:hypothetical protein
VACGAIISRDILTLQIRIERLFAVADARIGIKVSKGKCFFQVLFDKADGGSGSGSPAASMFEIVMNGARM